MPTCELDTDNCLTSDSSGGAVLDLPADREVAISAVKEGYTPGIIAYVTTDEAFASEQGVSQLPEQELTVIMEKHLGSEFPWQGGGR